jgi:hypothetical protein
MTSVLWGQENTTEYRASLDWDMREKTSGDCLEVSQRSLSFICSVGCPPTRILVCSKILDVELREHQR